MTGPEILREIVVKISHDRKKLSGTGFFVSETEIATCYHVLKDKSGQLSKCYFIKHDDWKSWMEVAPLHEKCNEAQDIAFLKCPIPIRLENRRIPFEPWDEASKEFRSRGYDCNTTEEEGASTIEGEDCRIIDYTSRKMEQRFQLSSIKKTLLPGRSGSPVWSVDQNAIVGMIDYRAGDENEQKEKSMAILIEKLPLDLPPIKGEPINVPSLPADFLPRKDDLDRLKELILSEGESRSAITGKAPNACNCSAPSIGLQGMGGIGKSVLAAALARDDEILEAFPDGVIWLALGQKSNLPNRQFQLLQFLDKDHRPVKDVQDGLGCLRILLRERSCLIVLDDVWAMDDVRAFDALGPNCRMLITTRDQKIVREIGAREFCLDMLSEADSMKLLALTSGLTLDSLDPKAGEVAEECDRLPLALAMVGSMAKAALKRGRPDPWEHILHRLLSADLEKINVDFPNYLYPNLMRAIEVSVDSLEPEERRHYLELAIFPEDTEVPEAALQLIWGLDQYDAADLADHFADRSLARLNAGRLSLHDLQHDFALKRAVDLAALHGKLVDAYRKTCPDGWHSGLDDGYFFQHIGYHLLHSERRNELKGLLLDLRWLQSRLEKTDLTSLISDFDLLPEDEEIRLCQSCLQLSSHVLFRDPDQLAGQLLGRMQHLEFQGIKSLMEQARKKKDRPWLRPMTASLTPPGGALIRTLVGHYDSVSAVALTNDDQTIVSSSYDRTLNVWDLNSGKKIRTLEGHDDFVTAVAVTRDGRTAVSASWDHTLKVWDLESGREIRTLKGHTNIVTAVVLSLDGQTVISGSHDTTLKAWDLKSGKEMQTLSGHDKGVLTVAISCDGRTVVSGSIDHTLKIWDLKSGIEMRTLAGHLDIVTTVALSPDGQTVISGSRDRTLKIWDLKTGREMRTLEGHADGITAVLLGPDGRTVISGSYDNGLKIWDLETGKETRALAGHVSAVKDICIAQNGLIVVSASLDNTLKVWNLDSENKARTLTGHTDSVAAIKLSADGQTVVSSSYDCTLKVWDRKSGKKIQTLAGHDRIVTAVAVSREGRTAVSGSHDHTLKVWDLDKGKEMRTLKGHADLVRAVVISHDGQIAVSASNDHTLKVWNLKNGLEMQSLTGHTDYICAITLTSNGRTLISASNDGTLKVWNVKNGREIKTLEGHCDGIYDVILGPDDLTAFSASGDCTIKEWNLKSGKEIRTLKGHADAVTFIALCLDGKAIISASNDGTLKVWDIRRGREIKTIAAHTVRGEPDWDDAVAISPNGQMVVSASDESTLKIWDIKSGSLIASFTGDSSILSCAIDPDDLTIVAGEASGRVHFLRLEGYDRS